MRARLTLATTLLASLAGAGLAVRWLTEREVIRVAATREPVSPGSGVAADPATLPSDRSGDRVDQELEVTRRDEAALTTGLGAKGGPVPLFGTVVVIDSMGREQTKLNGRIEVDFIDAGHDDSRTIAATEAMDVVEGVFRGKAWRGAMEVRSLVVDGASVAVHSALPGELVGRRVLHVGAHAPSRVSVSVVDASTKLPLQDVEIRQHYGAWSWSSRRRHSSPHVVRGASPIELTNLSPPPSGSGAEAPIPVEQVSVIAPGYEWKVAQIRFDPAIEQTIELTRGASLVVHLVGELPDPVSATSSLRVRRIPKSHEIESAVAAIRKSIEYDELANGHWPDPQRTDARIEAWRASLGKWSFHECVAELPIVDPGPKCIDGLAPGDYLVAVDLGDGWLERTVLGETLARLEVDATTTVTVAVDAGSLDPRRVPLSGTVRIPETWEVEAKYLSLQALGVVALPRDTRRFLRLEPMDGRAGLYRFEAPPVPPGRWTATVADVDWPMEFEVPPSGTCEVALAIPEPAIARIGVHKEGAAADADLEITAVSEAGGRRTRLAPSTFDLTDLDARQIRALPGRVRLGVLGDWEIVGPSTFELAPGTTELTLHVRRRTGIVLLLQGHAREWEPRLADRVTVSPLDHGGKACRMVETSRASWYVDRPGRWRVDVNDCEKDDQDFEVELATGTLVERTIRLDARD